MTGDLHIHTHMDLWLFDQQCEQWLSLCLICWRWMLPSRQQLWYKSKWKAWVCESCQMCHSSPVSVCLFKWLPSSHIVSYISSAKPTVCKHACITVKRRMRVSEKWEKVHMLFPCIFMKGHLFVADGTVHTVSSVIYCTAMSEGLYMWGWEHKPLRCFSVVSASFYTHVCTQDIHTSPYHTRVESVLYIVYRRSDISTDFIQPGYLSLTDQTH